MNSLPSLVQSTPRFSREIVIDLPDKLRWVFEGKARYRGAYGGRGSTKSRTFATNMLIEGTKEPGPLLCARELQNSLRDSVHAELCALVTELGLGWFYECGREYIRSRHNFSNRGYTEFVYTGLRNSQGIKSKSRFRRAWVEEAEYVSEQSWKDLAPTIRMPGSEIWLTWNREVDGSATDRRFIKSPPTNSRIVEINWNDNPWFPEELRQEMVDDYRRDPDMAAHVWGGGYTTRSDAQIMRDKWKVMDFEPQPHWDGPYDGADWGFSQDPTVRIRCWIEDLPELRGKRLYIEREAYMVGCETLDLPKLFDAFPDSRSTRIRGDNSRPETISHLKNDGFNITAADKWKGSVEDGITHLRGYEEIIIHTRCHNMINEARLYSYKVDRLTKDILADIIDKHNHCWDAVRYALDPVIQRKKGFFG